MQVNVDGQVEQFAKKSDAWREEGKGRTTQTAMGRIVSWQILRIWERRGKEWRREVMVAID